MIEKLKTELRKEVNLLESWIKTTKYGGWSTQLVGPMEKRVTELKTLLYDLDDKPCEWQKS
jgi:hypothetical protein